MAAGFSERVARKLPGWLKPPLRLMAHPLYRVWVRLECGLTSIYERFGPQPAARQPVPPPMMRFKVGGTPSRKVFLETGRRSAENLVAVLRQAGSPLEDPRFGRILDFGCGCGRTLRWLAPRFPGKRFWGCDVDPEMIAWCRDHLNPIEFAANRPRPPLEHAARAFDLIFAISVFTHLDEQLQLQWLEEFRRLLSPDGALLLTVHGEAVWSTQPAALRDEVQRRGTVTTRSKKLKGLLPDWYQTTFHTRGYMERTCRRLFAEVGYRPEALGFHDAVVCVRPLPGNDRPQ